MYIQDIQQKHEYTLKGKYFLITTKTDYKNALIEAKDMVNYIYPQRTTKELNLSNQRNNTSIIHTNLSTYTQALVQFHESNLVPETSSHKRLKLQFNDNSPFTKRNTTQDIPKRFTIKTRIKQYHLSIQKNPAPHSNRNSTLYRNINSFK